MKRSKSKITKIKALAESAREEAARKVFDLNTVHERITQVAAKGFNTVRIEPETAVDLRKTETAIATTKKLEELGYSYSWDVVNYDQKNVKNPSGCVARMSALVISWQDDYRTHL